jgi:hypothetical protein
MAADGLTQRPDAHQRMQHARHASARLSPAALSAASDDVAACLLSLVASSAPDPSANFTRPDEPDQTSDSKATSNQSSPMKTPSPSSVAALEQRMAGRTFHVVTLNGEAQHSVSPKSSMKEAKMQGRANSQRMPLGRIESNSMAPSVTLAIHSQQQLALSNSRARPPASPSKLRSPPRKIVPMHISDRSSSETTQIIECAASPSVSIDGTLSTSAAAPASPEAAKSAPPPTDACSPVNIADSALLRAVSAPSQNLVFSLGKPPIAQPASNSLTPSIRQMCAADLLRAKHYMMQNSNSRALTNQGGAPVMHRSVSSVTPSSYASKPPKPTGLSGPGGVKGRTTSSYPSRIRVCIKPIDQIKIRASSLLNDARLHKREIHHYEFP